jgi:hypothetical protein
MAIHEYQGQALRPALLKYPLNDRVLRKPAGLLNQVEPLDQHALALEPSVFG